MNRALRAATIGVLFLGPVTLSACSAGQVNQTALQVRDTVGTSVSFGQLDLRAVELAYPQGGRYTSGDDAVLTGAIVNNAAQPDVLLSISGPGFQGIRVTGTGAQGTAPLGPTAAPPQPSGATGTAGATASASATGQAGATGGAQSTALPSEAPSSDANIKIPGFSAVLLGQNAPHVALVGLTRDVTAAQSLPLTFTFRDAGSITVNVIVANPDTVLAPGSTYNFQPDEKGNRPANQVGGGVTGG